MERVTYGIMQREESSRLLDIYERCFGCRTEGSYVLGQKGYLTQYVARVGGIPAAMLSVFPVSVRHDGKNDSAAYLYGVATHPDFQGQGLCTGLMNYVHHALEGQGLSFALLVPSSEKNRRFYAARGYQACSSLCYGTFSGKASPAYGAEPVSAEEYSVLRQRFAPADALLWGKKGLSFQQGWLTLYGGGFWRLGKRDAPLGCAAVTREEGSFRVRELLLADNTSDAALLALCHELKADSLCYALPEELGRKLGMPETPLAMIFPLGTKGTLPLALYANLVLD